MSFVKLSISDFLEQQLPDFIVSEFPTFVKFFREYYRSLEIKGGILDINQNLLEYKDFDNLTKFNLVKNTKLTNEINSTTTSIKVDSLVGFEQTNGIVQIDSEIIFYQKIDKTNNTLLNCQRGYSATTELKDIGTSVSTSTSASHIKGSTVTNLSNLFLFSLIKNYEDQYLEGFPYTQLDSDIDVVTLLKHIKDFYSFKGTATSIEFLFRSIYDEEILVKYPRDYLIKTSYSDWTVDDIIKVEAISGNPYDIVGNEIKQTDASGASVLTAIVDTILVNNISNYASGNKNIYEIRLNILNRSNFKVPHDTILRRPLTSTDTVITVDSTIGFAEENGIIQIDDEIITYRYKSFNQFFDCTRGTYKTVKQSHLNLASVRTTEYLYGYKGGVVSDTNLVKLRLIGVLSSTTIDDGASYYQEEESIEVSSDGVSDNRPQFTTWRLNEDGNLSSSSNTEINNAIKNITTEVSAVYKTNNFAYISSTGLPNHPIGPFVGTSNNASNQFLLKSIPLKSEKITQIQPVGNRAVGLFINGVEAYSCKDLQTENFGGIDSVEIIQGGYGFDDGVQPVFRLKNAVGSGATFSATVSNGKIQSVSVVNIGNNYTADSDLEIAYGFDAKASIINDTDLYRGSIKTITVVSGGTNYIVPPLVEITDINGRGRGAYAIATISGGTVTGINVLSGGIDYTDRTSIRINLVSKGAGVIARAKVKKWNYDRVFRLLYTQNTNGSWLLSQNTKLDAGNGYLYPSADIRYGSQYAYAHNPKILRSSLNDNVQNVSFNYEEITSNFTHSPILGWAYDGNPIYGPYGYSNPYNTSSSIKRMVSGYKLISSVPVTRPNVSNYPLGAFIEDYEYVNGTGDLDFNNGRFCITPEFPNGTYAYFITVDSFGKGVFPYILGKTYNSVPSETNFLVQNNQTEINLPLSARRLKTSKTPVKGFDSKLIINNVDRGIVDNFVCSSGNTTFKVGDYLFIDSTNTEGAGAFGSVESVFGVTVSSVTYSVASGYTASGLTIVSGRTQYPFPTKITAPGYTIPYEAYVTTNTPHLLSDGDSLFINLDQNILQITKTFKVRVGSYQTVNYITPSITTSLDADVAFNQTNINVISATQFRINDYISINDEILKITNINYINNQFTVLRSQLGTPLRLHSATNSVKLYIPSDQQDYKINVGDSINSSGVSGTIYNIDKQNKTFQVRVISGNLTSTSVINDSSIPTTRQILISSVTPKITNWEIDPTNTGNYYVRDLSFELIRGTRYIFDVSDGSNFGYVFSLSEDYSNINPIRNITSSGTPGTIGANIILSEDVLKDSNVSRVYFYEQNNLITNNRVYFEVKNYFDGLKTIKKINDYVFKFSLDGQLEGNLYNNANYFTFSKSAIGAISKLKTNDGGEGYKKLPIIEGVVHSDLDNAKFAYSLSGGSISDSVSVLLQGNRYSQKTILKVISSTGTGAVLVPTIANGKIISVKVTEGGRNYSLNDKIVAVDSDIDCYAVSSSIGKIKTIRFANYGTQFNIDRTLAKQLIFSYKLILTNFSDEVYKNSEILNTSNGAQLQVIRTQQLGSKSYLVDVKILVGEIVKNAIVTGTIKQTTSKIAEIKYPEIFGNISGYVKRVGFFDSDLGKLNSSSQKITDSYYYQDFSYVIRSTRSLKEYKSKVDKSTHPLGFKLFGEVAIEGGGTITNSGITGTGSVTLPNNYSDNTVVLITASGINVESFLNYRRYEVQTINTRNPAKIPGQGAALLNFLDNQIEAVKISDVSSSFSGGTSTYRLTTQDGNFPVDTKNTSILLSINEIFQEPVERKNISSISYVNNIATITTTTDHGYAYTSSGITYPENLYTTIENCTFSGSNINFNDRFEIYSVNSPNTFKVLFNNPNGYLTNNEPGVCADVQSTVDNLIGILTTAVSNPSGFTFPLTNIGVWTSSGTTTIVSANRHRDASNLIASNRQEIIDRANAEIGVQYPDFYYPNDPQTTSTSRFKDSYRLIQLNKQEIIDGAFAVISGFTGNPNPTKCKRDIGYFIDAISLDVHTGGNRYSIEFLKQYFNSTGTSLTTNGLLGEISESVTAFNKARDLMKDAITNQLTIKDLTITADPTPASGVSSNTNPTSCTNVRTNIDNLASIVSFYLNQGSLTYPTALPSVTSGVTASGETKCKRDIGYIVDAVVLDLFTGGNYNIITATKSYLTTSGNTLLPNGISGEVPQSVVAFNKARDVMKLALANQLYNKNFNILPDFLGTSGTLSPSNLSNAKVVKGAYEYNSNFIKFYDPPKEGSTFSSIFYKFVNGSDDFRYSYKVKNILFDGITKEFNLYKIDDTPLVTESDENLVVFVDGVLQIYGESYTINRSVFPNKIVFFDEFDAKRNFFAYSFSKYKILNDISSLFNDSAKSFDLVYQNDNIKLPDINQLLVLLDGVPQVEGDTYSVNENIITFNEAPTKGKICHLLYFYGKTFEKTISIWNGKIFERLQDIGLTTPDGCKYFNRVTNTYEYIKPGDQILIDGETPKELISFESNALLNSDNYQYNAFVYTDNSYIRGKNAVATAVISGTPIIGANTVTISGTTAISGVVSIPTVYDFKVTSVNIDNPGYEYDIPPIVLFKTSCDNPGKGAAAYATVQNGKVSSVVVTNPGSGYTAAPDVFFAKRYEIIKNKYPVYDSKEIVVDTRLNDGLAILSTPGFTASTAVGSEEEYELPIAITQITASKQITIDTENWTNRDPSKPALSYVLQNLDFNKFTYEPLELNANLNGAEAPYLYQGMTIQTFSRYFPNLTIGDFTERLGRTTGSTEPNIMNVPQDGYVSFGLTLASGITSSGTTITVSGNTSKLPPSGYIEFGDESIYYTSISGVTLLNCQRGALNTSAISHSAGQYIRLAWRG